MADPGWHRHDAVDPARPRPVMTSTGNSTRAGPTVAIIVLETGPVSPRGTPAGALRSSESLEGSASGQVLQNETSRALPRARIRRRDGLLPPWLRAVPETGSRADKIVVIAMRRNAIAQNSFRMADCWSPFGVTRDSSGWDTLPYRQVVACRQIRESDQAVFGWRIPTSRPFGERTAVEFDMPRALGRATRRAVSTGTGPSTESR